MRRCAIAAQQGRYRVRRSEAPAAYRFSFGTAASSRCISTAASSAPSISATSISSSPSPPFSPYPAAASSSSSSSSSSSPSSSFSSSSFSVPRAPLPRNSTLDSILRVDHAGEYGAQCIYEGQLAALRLRSALSSPASPFSLLAAAVLQPPRSHSHSHIDRSIRVIEEMRDQEVEHLNGLEALLPRHRSRPTALLPLWHVAGYTLGYTTALLGTRAAMACTVAVEEVITEHYNDQLRTLASDEWKEAGEQWDETQQAEMRQLRALIRKNRDDEENHRDIGIEHEAEQTPFYSVLTSLIKTGCQAAIAVAKKV